MSQGGKKGRENYKYKNDVKKEPYVWEKNTCRLILLKPNAKAAVLRDEGKEVDN